MHMFCIWVYANNSGVGTVLKTGSGPKGGRIGLLDASKRPGGVRGPEASTNTTKKQEFEARFWPPAKI